MARSRIRNGAGSALALVALVALAPAAAHLAGCGASPLRSDPPNGPGLVVPPLGAAGADAGEPARPPASVSAAELARRIESFAIHASPFECDYDVETRLNPPGPPVLSKVHVSFARPGELKAKLADGSFVYVKVGTETVHASPRQRTSRREVERDHCPIALVHATGPGTLERFFALETQAGASRGEPGLDVLVGRRRLVPLPAVPTPTSNPSPPPPVGVPPASEPPPGQTATAPLAEVALFSDHDGMVRRAVIVLANGEEHTWITRDCTLQAPSASLALSASKPVVPAAASAKGRAAAPGARPVFPRLLVEALPR